MKRGKVIMSWSDPPAWHQALAQQARSEKTRCSPWVSWFLIFCLFAGFIMLEWRDAGPESRVSIPILVSTIAITFASFIGLAWLEVRLNRTKKTTYFEFGILQGSRFNKQWTAWSDIDCFHTEEVIFESWTFRFLNGKKVEDETDYYSVIPESVGISAVADLLKMNNVEEIEPIDEDEDP